MTRPRLLWVTEEVPDRRAGGGNIRQANLLRHLGQRFDVDLLVAGRVTDDAVRAAVRSVEEVPVDGPWRIGRARTAFELLVRRRSLAEVGAGAAGEALRERLGARSQEADLVLLHHEALLPLVDAVRGPVGVHTFDVRSVRAAQSAEVAPTWRRRWLWRAEARAAARLVRRHLPAVDLVVTCTAADLRSLTTLDGRASVTWRGIVAPNGVDPAAFASTAPPRAGRVLFLGSLDYEPNVDAITWFAATAWPRIRAAVPSATLVVAGHRPTPEVLALARLDGVEVSGPVEEAATAYAGSDVTIAPLRVGTGSRLKVLESLAAGRPVVGTSVGLEGLDLTVDGTDGAVAADSPEALAGAVVALLQDPDAAAAAGAAGRTRVAAAAAWEVIAADLASELEEALVREDAPGATVVVCTRGRPDLLEANLRSLGAALGPADDLLVVEADGAGAAPLVAATVPAARHVAAQEPGKSRQLNLGLREASHPVVVLTDDDCEVAPGWVAAMAAPFADPAVGAVFGPVVGLSGVRDVELVPPVPGPAPERTWEYANGAAMAVRRSAVRQVGGFDERLGPGAPVHGEEHDLVLRLQEAGWEVRIADAPAVRHLDWRDEAATRGNLLVYSRGAGAFLGAALRRAPRRHARLLARRIRYQAWLWRHTAAEGSTFGPATTLAFAQGLARGLLLPPWGPSRGAAQPRRRRSS